jgi:hypothetical protein
MPMHIDRVDSAVTVAGDGVQLNDAQLTRLSELVKARMRREERREKRLRAAMKLHRSADPKLRIGD